MRRSEEKANKAITKAAALINICTREFEAQLEDAVDMDTLNNLQECPYGEEGQYPDCLPSIIEQIMVRVGGARCAFGFKLVMLKFSGAATLLPVSWGLSLQHMRNKCAGCYP